jgi:pimeloyl-ACP methyl ester carboxylesterase
MAAIHVNGIDLHYEIDGDGPPLVLVHGHWGDRLVWDAIAGSLAHSFTVLRYDRRGHGRSGQEQGPAYRRQHEDDLAALIERVHGEPAYVVGTSYGGLISLGLVGRRPNLVRAVTVHEPPAVSVADTGELAYLAGDAQRAFEEVATRIASGDVESGTRHFMEAVALGPGGWQLLPEQLRWLALANAEAFAADYSDPYATYLDIDAVADFGGPLLLTKGSAAPPVFQQLVERLAELLPNAGSATVVGAGHGPHLSHPQAYAQLVTTFLGNAAARDLVTAIRS